MTSLRQRFTEDMQVRNLAPNTQQSYVQQISLFARHFRKSPELLGPEDIRAYQVYLTNEKKLAPGSITIAVAALRFLYQGHSPQELGLRRRSSPLPRSRRNCRLFLARKRFCSFLGTLSVPNIASF